jgi:2-(1,2-epoxy-1,2-dihydrophenyl)acetyl-CoA isomerase
MTSDGNAQTYAEMVQDRGPLSEYRVVRYEIDSGIAVVTLNDPEAMNSYSIRMTGELRRALRESDEDPAIRAIILTGAGRAFSAGGDLRRMRQAALVPAERYEFIRREFGGLIQQIVSSDKPVLAAVNGFAMGVGLFTALSCDMIVASEKANFGTAYIHLALAPLGVSYLLAKAIGYCRAYELCALGDPISAHQAKELGLVNRVVAHDRLMDETRKIAKRLVEGPPRGLAFTKQLLRRAFHPDLEEHLLLGEAVQPICLGTEDHREAVRAFGEKRKPVFNGR